MVDEQEQPERCNKEQEDTGALCGLVAGHDGPHAFDSTAEVSEGTPIDVDYSAQNKSELQLEAERRGLPIGGTKDELIERLEANDLEGRDE